MKLDLKSFLIGALLILVISLIIGAKITAGGGGSTVSVTCSSDGKFVYVGDYNSVKKSEDFGETWKDVLSYESK